MAFNAGRADGPLCPVRGDERAGLLQIGDAKPVPAASDGARVAPGPSERPEPAAPEVRQAPAGGEAQGKPREAGEGKRHD